MPAPYPIKQNIAKARGVRWLLSGGDDKGDSPTRRFATPGLEFAGSESLQALSRHQRAFDRRLQIGLPGAEPEHDALGRAACVDGFEIAHNHDVADPRRRLARSLYGWRAVT
jgi:hypothetical protein